MAFPALSRTNADVAGTDRDVAVLGGEQAREHADLDACTRQRSCTVAGIRDRGTVVVGSVVGGRSPMAVQRHRIAGIRERVHSLVQVGGGLTLWEGAQDVVFTATDRRGLGPRWSQRGCEVQGIGMTPVWDDTPDERLLATTRAEPAAFSAFYRRHEDRILSYFLARVGDPEVAADLTAETFAAALANAHRFRPRRKPAVAWLFGIARNKLAMSRRRGRVDARARRRLGMAPLVLTDEAIERISALDHTALALVDELPGDQREAVRARVIDERDYPEIAKDLRCSEAVVRKRVSRGLGTLRARLEEK